MILKLIMTYDVNETTGEMKYIGKEEIAVDTSVAIKATKSPTTRTAEMSNEPLLILDNNKYTLTSKAMELLGVAAGDNVHINYPKKSGDYVPAIASSSTLGVKAGNKITKSNSVSFRGSANERLAEYGTTFKLEASEKDGLFYLVSDKMLAPKSDADEIIKIDDDFELDDLNDIDLDQDAESVDIKFDLTL